AICGPITVTLWASSTTLDTDFFVLLSDVGPDGGVQYLQRGLLRASHRALDEGASLWADVKGEKTLIRPHHPHVDPEPLYPRRPYRFDIEVFPVGHVFRSGHKLSLSISQPPLDDPVPVANKKWGTYKYESNQPPGIVTIYWGADYPSRILLPVLPDLPPISGNPHDVGDHLGIYLQNKDPERKTR
ncbi:MAG: CocE/NonD family hydrolase C-terminal non-catalytic domain-containing protein, partial [Planctomycetota bacterium]